MCVACKGRYSMFIEMCMKWVGACARVCMCECVLGGGCVCADPRLYIRYMYTCTRCIYTPICVCIYVLLVYMHPYSCTCVGAVPGLKECKFTALTDFHTCIYRYVYLHTHGHMHIYARVCVPFQVWRSVSSRHSQTFRRLPFRTLWWAVMFWVRRVRGQVSNIWIYNICLCVCLYKYIYVCSIYMFVFIYICIYNTYSRTLPPP